MLESRLRDLITTLRDDARRQGINAEFGFHRERSSLIRLGNSAVALSTYEELTRVNVRVTDGRRTGSVGLTADLVSLAQLRDALQRAADICAASPEKDYQPLFGEVEESIDDATGFDPALDTLSPAAKTALCAEVIHTVGARGNYDFSGSWSTGSSEVYVTTTANDREVYRTLTDSKLLLVLKEQQKKWELNIELGGKTADQYSARAIIDHFVALLPYYEEQPGYRAPLGPSRVIFGPQAIAELAFLTVWGAFDGRMWEEKRAFTSGKPFGERIFGEQITILDDPTHANVFQMPFDMHGRRRRPFVLAEQGCFSGLMYDSSTAAKYGKQPTGHDTGSLDLVIATGAAPAGLPAGLALAGDALYIPHLHYVHMPDPSQGQFTGSSRFNALRVAGGQLTAPMLSSRVTDTLPNILSHVVAISAGAQLFNMSDTYGRRTPNAVSVPDYLICDNVRISDVAESF